jgi:hypothetical protein
VISSLHALSHPRRPDPKKTRHCWRWHATPCLLSLKSLHTPTKQVPAERRHYSAPLPSENFPGTMYAVRNLFCTLFLTRNCSNQVSQDESSRLGLPVAQLCSTIMSPKSDLTTNQSSWPCGIRRALHLFPSHTQVLTCLLVVRKNMRYATSMCCLLETFEQRVFSALTTNVLF